MRKIYLLTQDVNVGYDIYDSMVIIAEDKEEAILLSYEQDYGLLAEDSLDNMTPAYIRENYTPLETKFKNYTHKKKNKVSYNSWAYEDDIVIQELGYADLEIKESYVVCASFNAG